MATARAECCVLEVADYAISQGILIRGSLAAKHWAFNPASAGATPALGPNRLSG